jgi:hypothetical protein
MKRSLSQAQLRAIRNQTRGRLTGLNVALRELRRQRTEKPHHRYSHFEDLSASEALNELETRLATLADATRAKVAS